MKPPLCLRLKQWCGNNVGGVVTAAEDKGAREQEVSAAVPPASMCLQQNSCTQTATTAGRRAMAEVRLHSAGSTVGKVSSKEPKRRRVR